ncbi:hypothetical protein CEQ90_05390 [Lewinellaceae bacterium SD302]|nr:hypothetical protein CEQ90_05390 [Lewinellaceae bacterium SD302]
MARLYGTIVPAFLLLHVLFFLNAGGLKAQDFRITSTDLLTFCGGNFVDGGGQAGQHTVGTTQMMTICSDSPAPNSHISLTFDFLQIDGVLTVYNDDNSLDPADILTVIDNTANGTSPTVTATATNASGCLTFVFEGAAAAPGWSAPISCVMACQSVEAGLFFTDPEIEPVDTGYIDVCLGDTVTFVGGGIYSENDFIYNQSDATSTLAWTFTDGFTSDQGTVQRVFEEAGGYIMNLKVTDVLGCESTNLFRQRIRVAPEPTFNLQTDFVSEVCASDTIVLAGSTEINPNPSSEIFVDSDSVGFPVGLELADTTFLPDGTGPNGFYQTSLEFTSFEPGATLDDVDDLIEICLNMEHSYAGDLDIWIECPNGSTTFFLDYPNGQGNRFFGEPVDIDADLSPGIGYDYCWSPSGTQTVDQLGDAIGMNGGDSYPNGSVFAAVEPFENLLGCPLNGPWTINVQDNLFSDNGYIFSWSIQFADYLYPNAERFKVGIEDKYWVQQDNMIFYEPDSIRALATFSGINAYSYEVVDSFGCIYDTTLTVEVNPFVDPDCYSCQPILDSMQQEALLCGGTPLQTTLATREFLDTLIPWAAFPYEQFRNGDYPSLSESYSSVITVDNMRPLNITDATFTIESVCVDIETEAAGDIRLFLVSPAGSLFELSSGNGGAAPNYTNTCFTPDAITPIQSGVAPFTGDYLPETDFSFLNGAPINGDWTIRAWDIAGGNNDGEFRSWSITFRHENDITYNWLPDDGNLSCTDCPNPVITAPDSDQVYTLTATDQFGCSETGTVTVTVGDIPADLSVIVDNPACSAFEGGTATVDVPAGTIYDYAWSHGPTTQTVTNLDPGDYTVTISSGNCETTRDVTILATSAIEASIDEVINVSCNGGSDGQINVNSSGGNGELTYAWDDPNLQVLEDAVFLDAGTYTLIITDENGCMDTLTSTVTQPDPLELSFGTDAVDCNGGSDGSATVTPQGGNGDYNFNWETGGEEATITNVAAGTYSVTVTDLEGCQIVDSVSVTQPAEAVSLQTTQDQMGCSEASLNIATVAVLGGQMPYTYSWPNGANTATAENLSAGLNTVTVTDAAGCETTTEITLTDLEPISFNLFASDPSCNGSTDGGMGLNQLTGGAGLMDEDYTFLWSTGSTEIVASNLIGGVEYSLTVTDQQGCNAVQSRFLDDPAPVELAVDDNAVSCFGFSDGSVSVLNITGPNPGGFDIQWDAAANNAQDSTVTGLPAGVYNVEVTDSEGCTATEMLVISEPSLLELELDKVDATCFGDVNGSIQTTVSGGIPDYSFAWSNGSSSANLENLPAGNYQLVLNDANGCEEIQEIEIVQPEEVVASATSEAAICNGDATGTVTIEAIGGNEPYVYGLQNTGFSQRNEFIGLPAGDYEVIVRDARGCQGNTEITVEDGPIFSVDLGPDLDIVFGDSINFEPIVSGAVGELIYAWSGSYDGTLLCLGDTAGRDTSTVVFCPDPNVKPEYEIDYRLRLIDENGCEAEDRIRVRVEKIRVVEVPQGFTPNNDGQNDKLFVHGRPGTVVKRFSVFDRWGELVYEDVDFPVNDLNRGWDGSYKDEDMMGGVYLWQVEAVYEDGSVELLTGQTSLLR